MYKHINTHTYVYNEFYVLTSRRKLFFVILNYSLSYLITLKIPLFQVYDSFLLRFLLLLNLFD